MSSFSLFSNDNHESLTSASFFVIGDIGREIKKRFLIFCILQWYENNDFFVRQFYKLKSFIWKVWIKILYNLYRVFYGFRQTKQDDCFWVYLEHFWNLKLKHKIEFMNKNEQLNKQFVSQNI